MPAMTEEVGENIIYPAGAKTKVLCPEPFKSMCTFKSRLSELVIFSPLFRIAESFVRFIYFLEFFLFGLISGI